LKHHHPIALNNINSNGHTILDGLMMSILRSHTNVTPGEISTNLADSTRFLGEEKDICGRWDADSVSVRQLYRQGNPRIPTEWKHIFCHSAAQAICHSMIAIFGPPSSPKID